MYIYIIYIKQYKDSINSASVLLVLRYSSCLAITLTADDINIIAITHIQRDYTDITMLSVALAHITS